MRAALLTQYREDFVIGSVPDPTITSPNDVIVRVVAAGPAAEGEGAAPGRRVRGAAP